MRVLVTGGTGFVGSFVAAHLLDHGHEVVCFDRRAEPNPVLARLLDRLTLVQGDVLEAEEIRGVVEAHGVDGIVHAAAVISQTDGARDPRRMYRINVEGTLNVLEAARSANARLVYVSTATLYGQHPDLPLLHEDRAPDPVGIYDTTKLMAETLVLGYHKVFGLDTVAVRPGYVYGPFNSTGGYLLDRVLAGEAVDQPEGADLPMDVTYVKDLAHGVVLALTARPIQHPVFNVTGGVLRRRAEVADIVRQLVPGARIRLGPGIPAAAHLRGPSDLTRARTELGYVPRYTLESGMADWLTEVRR